MLHFKYNFKMQGMCSTKVKKYIQLTTIFLTGVAFVESSIPHSYCCSTAHLLNYVNWLTGASGSTHEQKVSSGLNKTSF